MKTPSVVQRAALTIILATAIRKKAQEIWDGAKKKKYIFIEINDDFVLGSSKEPKSSMKSLNEIKVLFPEHPKLQDAAAKERALTKNQTMIFADIQVLGERSLFVETINLAPEVQGTPAPQGIDEKLVDVVVDRAFSAHTKDTLLAKRREKQFLFVRVEKKYVELGASEAAVFESRFATAEEIRKSEDTTLDHYEERYQGLEPDETLVIVSVLDTSNNHYAVGIVNRYLEDHKPLN